MLWIAIATVILTPRAGSERAPVKVASPSGKLCIAIAKAENIPMRSSRLSLWEFHVFFFVFLISCGFSKEGMNLSINAISPMPAKKEITV